MASAESEAVSLAVPGESRTELVYIVSAVLTASSMIIFGLRLFTRCVLLKTAGSDDWTMLVAQILAIVAGVFTILEAYYGLGRHIETLSQSSIRSSLICLYGVVVSYNTGLNVVKVSFLLQYRRIFPSPRLRRICLWSLGFICAWGVVQLVLLAITCVPIANIVPETSSWCLDTLPIWEFTSIVSLFTDFAIFFLPLPSIWELPIPRRQKSVLFGIFGLGFFHLPEVCARATYRQSRLIIIMRSVCVISIIRVPTLRAASSAADPTWDNVEAAIWTLAEINAAILCSSLPVLRPLFFKVSGSVGYGKRSRTRTTGLAERSESGNMLRDLHKSHTTTVEQAPVSGAGDSSEDLVTATFDEMIYGSRGRQSSGGGLRKTWRGNPPDITPEGAIELGLPSRQES